MKKRVTIPLKENDNLVLSALTSLRNSLNNLNINNDELQYAIFDLNGLIGIFSGEFKVTIEIEQEKMDSFVSKFGVDFPKFDNMEVVDIVEDKKDVEDEQVFDHLAYIEDGGLVLAIRSNKHFEGSSCEDDSDMPYYRYEYAEKGNNLFVEGYSALHYSQGWVIIKDGEVLVRAIL